jgi:hypothetical protein
LSKNCFAIESLARHAKSPAKVSGSLRRGNADSIVACQQCLLLDNARRGKAFTLRHIFSQSFVRAARQRKSAAKPNAQTERIRTGVVFVRAMRPLTRERPALRAGAQGKGPKAASRVRMRVNSPLSHRGGRSNYGAAMSPDYYRAQASLCRKRAREAPSHELAAKWKQMAAEYDQLADCFLALPDAPSRRSGSGALN